MATSDRGFDDTHAVLKRIYDLAEAEAERLDPKRKRLGYRHCGLKYELVIALDRIVGNAGHGMNMIEAQRERQITKGDNR